MDDSPESRADQGALAPGLLLGLGLGGFFDGVVLHQILQWHHMISHAGPATDTLAGLQLNTLADGLFHAACWLFTAAGLILLWRRAQEDRMGAAGRLLPGAILIGFGLFNLVEGLVNHQILGLHHVNETAPREHWLWWDLGFLTSGVLLIGAGWGLVRRVQR